MTEEEREAIKYLEQIKQDFLNSAKKRRENGENTGYGTLEDVDKLSAFEIGIILNLIQKQQEEIEKKDKIIDEISKNPYNELKVNGILFTGTDIKQYFEKEVKDFE